MPQSFLEVARELIDSPEAKAAYADDPDGFLAARGLEGLAPDELEAATGFVADALPAPVARQLGASFSSEPVPGGGRPPSSDALAQLASTTAVEEAVREAEPGTVDLAAVLDPGGELGVPDPVDVGAVVPRAAGSDGDAAGAGADVEGTARTDDGAPHAVDDSAAELEGDVDDDIGGIEDADIQDIEEEEGHERLETDELALDDPLPGADDLDPGLTDAIGTLPGDPLGPGGALGDPPDDPLGDLD